MIQLRKVPIILWHSGQFQRSTAATCPHLSPESDVIRAQVDLGPFMGPRRPLGTGRLSGDRACIGWIMHWGNSDKREFDCDVFIPVPGA